MTFAGSLPGGVVNYGVLALDPPAFSSLTLGGVISNTGKLVMSGNGVAILTATNTYSGPTLISAGTLQVGNGTSNGALGTESAITNNSTLAFNNSGATTFTSAGILGSGGIAQLGPGLLVLNSINNTFTGGVTVSGGTLDVTASNGSFVGNPAASAFGAFNAPGRTITVNSGGVLQYAIGNATGNSTSTDSPALVINGGEVISTVGTDANYFSSLAFSGGTLTSLGGYSTLYPAWGFASNTAGTVSASGATPALISGTGASNALALAASTTFNVTGAGRFDHQQFARKLQPRHGGGPDLDGQWRARSDQHFQHLYGQRPGQRRHVDCQRQ